MTAGVTKDLLDCHLAQVLWDHGLYAWAENERDYSADGLANISVRIDSNIGAVATMWRSAPGGFERLDESIDSLLERESVKFAVAVCYPDDLASSSIEAARYVWRMKPKRGAKTGLMSGGIVALALAISLVYGGPREPGDAARELADRLSESGASASATVLPISFATSLDFEWLRKILAEDFRIIFIVASHDRRRAGFSGNGEKPEVLVICNPRYARGSETSGTMVINLYCNPSTLEEARDAGSDIRKSIQSGEESAPGSGIVQSIESRELEEGDWGAVQFMSPTLRERSLNLKRGDMFPVTCLGAIADIGPTGRAVRGAFVRVPSTDAGEYKGFWGHGSDNVRTMRVKAESVIVAKPKNLTNANKHWKRRTRLLLPLQPHLPRVRSMAIRLDEPALGSMWTNCRLKPKCQEPDQFEKALCVYLNFTVGILMMLGGFIRDNNFTRRRSTVKGWRMLSVPDFARCSGALKALVAAFDELGECELSPLPESGNCSVRRAIDGAVYEALGISEELMHRIRSHLVREPSITGERYQIEERQLSLF